MHTIHLPIARKTLFAVLLASPLLCTAYTTSIADHGAVGDGHTLNTNAIQQAIEDCVAHGGGTVVVPAGSWLTGGLELKSKTTLRVESGGVLKASSSLSDYPPIGFQHPEFKQTRSLIWAIDCQDITLAGEGEIDLTDRPFFNWTLLRTGLPTEQDEQLESWQRDQCVVTALERPEQPIFFHRCENLHLEGLTIRNSPCWTITISCCSDVRVTDLRIDNNLNVPNNDGIHFSGSRNIVVSGCIIRGGDDSLAFTGITNPASACENIAVTNCVLTSRSAAVRLGYQAAKVRNVTLSNLIIKDSNRGFVIQAGDDGVVERVMISNCVLETKMFAGAWWGKGEPFVISAGGTNSGLIRGVSLFNVRCQAENSALIVGHQHSVRDITLSDTSVRLSVSRNTALYGQKLDLAPFPGAPSPLIRSQLPWLYVDSVSDLTLVNCKYEPASAEASKLALDPIFTQVERLKMLNPIAPDTQNAPILDLRRPR